MRYFTIFFLLITCNSFAQSNDCKKFKTGTFTYANVEEKTTIITRTDSTQIEFNKKTGVKFTGSIKWVSDCKYILTYIDVNSPDYSSVIGVVFNVDITSTTENSYEYLAYDDKRKMTGEIVKIE